jgi:hypothetical protein
MPAHSRSDENDLVAAAIAGAAARGLSYSDNTSQRTGKNSKKSLKITVNGQMRRLDPDNKLDAHWLSQTFNTWFGHDRSQWPESIKGYYDQKRGVSHKKSHGNEGAAAPINGAAHGEGGSHGPNGKAHDTPRRAARRARVLAASGLSAPPPANAGTQPANAPAQEGNSLKQDRKARVKAELARRGKPPEGVDGLGAFLARLDAQEPRARPKPVAEPDGTDKSPLLDKDSPEIYRRLHDSGFFSIEDLADAMNSVPQVTAKPNFRIHISEVTAALLHADAAFGSDRLKLEILYYRILQTVNARRGVKGIDIPLTAETLFGVEKATPSHGATAKEITLRASVFMHDSLLKALDSPQARHVQTMDQLLSPLPSEDKRALADLLANPVLSYNRNDSEITPVPALHGLAKILGCDTSALFSVAQWAKLYQKIHGPDEELAELLTPAAKRAPAEPAPPPPRVPKPAAIPSATVPAAKAGVAASQEIATAFHRAAIEILNAYHKELGPTERTLLRDVEGLNFEGTLKPLAEVSGRLHIDEYKAGAILERAKGKLVEAAKKAGQEFTTDAIIGSLRIFEQDTESGLLTAALDGKDDATIRRDFLLVESEDVIRGARKNLLDRMARALGHVPPPK